LLKSSANWRVRKKGKQLIRAACYNRNNTFKMEPGEALGIAAQIAVALAGFAGVVVVFRRESVHEWSLLDKLRLRLLLANSILPLGLSMIGMLLLTIKPMPPELWRWCSAMALVVFLMFLATTAKFFRRLGQQEVQRERGTRFMQYFFGTLGMAAMLLQAYNVALLGAFWPFFAGVVYQLVTAVAQFARMILLLPE